MSEFHDYLMTGRIDEAAGQNISPEINAILQDASRDFLAHITRVLLHGNAPRGMGHTIFQPRTINDQQHQVLKAHILKLIDSIKWQVAQER